MIDETIRECLEESTDLPRTVKLLEGIESGAIRVVAVDAIAPSVFAHRLLLAWDYSFLDDGERANRRSRTVQMNRGMAEDVFRKEDLSDLLSAEAVESVVAEVSGRAAGRRPRSRDELFELIRAHGSMTQSEVEERVGESARTMLTELDAERRIARVILSGELVERIIASEDQALFAAAYSSGDGGDARTELVRRALKTCGPTTAGEVATRLRLKESEIEQSLAALEGQGAIFRGHFTRADVIQWCDRYNLERIHRDDAGARARRDRAVRRSRLRGVPAAMDACRRRRSARDQTGVAAVLDQLSGVAATPEIWEHAILPARVAGYRPEMLDLVCMSGQMKWVAVAGRNDRRRAACERPVASHVHRRARPLCFRRDEEAASEDCEGAGGLARSGSRRRAVSRRGRRARERFRARRAVRAVADGRGGTSQQRQLRAVADVHRRSRRRTRARSVARRPATRRDAAVRARLKSSLAGRWSVIRAAETPAVGAQTTTRELALKLLERHGIVAREMLAIESTHISWNEIAFALRRLEYGGAIRRGWFVRSLSGEQYALPEAVEMLQAARNLIPAREKPVALSAIDPANPYGAMLPGCGVAREAGNVIVVRAGRVIAGLQGRAMISGSRGRRRRREFRCGGCGSHDAEAALHDRFNRRRAGARVAASGNPGRDAIPFGRPLAGVRRIAWPGARPRLAPSEFKVILEAYRMGCRRAESLPSSHSFTASGRQGSTNGDK